MKHRPASLFAFALIATLPTWCAGEEAGQKFEYKPADQNFYLRAAVLKAEPSAVIFRAGEFEQKGDSYFVHPTRHPAKDVYVEVVKDWLEPVTPPSMPDSLGLALDVMQIREPQGSVQVAPPDNPTGFVAATDGMPIANGAVVKTGKDGTAAILFGGVDSARLAPDSEALVQQTVMPELRSTRVDLKSGVVFSKVGLRPGEKQDFQVHTPFGVAMAKGTDFVCMALPDRADVWVAQGTVRFNQPNGVMVSTVHSTGKGALKLIRIPAIKDAQAALDATTQDLTAALNFIPVANVKLKTLHDQMSQGVQLSSQAETYLKLMKHVPCLIRLTLVSPLPPEEPAPAPKPAAATVAAPVAPTAEAPAVVPAAAPSVVENSAPIAPQTPASFPSATPEPAPKPALAKATIVVARDGSIHFEGTQLSAGHLEKKLAEIAKSSPKCAVTIRGDRKWQGSRIQTVMAMCHEAKLEDVTLDTDSEATSP